MCDALQSPFHPASTQVWSEGGMGLGVLEFDSRVSGALIQKSEDGGSLAADVRLDNTRELRDAYRLRQGLADPAIAAAALAEGGAGAVERMIGEFALARWSPREQHLLLAVDALGVRPLVYHHEPGRHLVFASFPAGIFASGLVARSLDELELGRQILRAYLPGATLFRGIHSILPGHTLQVTRSGLQDHTYWRPERQPTLRISREEAAEQLRDLVSTAVEGAAGTAPQVAAHLSGGLDSSSLTVLAARALRREGRSLRAYSFLGEAWPGLDIDGEEPFVEAVLQQEQGIDWTPIQGGMPPDWLHDRWNADMPLSLSAESPENIVCADASSHGAAVVISGWGGDEGITFNGRGALAAAFRGLQWQYLFSEVQSLRQERGFALRNILIGDVLQPQLSRSTTNLLRRMGGRAALAEPLEPKLLRAEIREWLAVPDGTLIGPNPGANQVRLLQAGHIAFRTGHFAAIAARYGMAFSFPLLNRRVIEFALSIPATWHIGGGWKRRLYRDAMQGVLPPAIQWRHNKLLSLPRVLYDYTAARDRVLERVRQLAVHPVVSSIFDLEEITRRLEALPRVEDVRQPSAEPALADVPALAHTLNHAFYVEQHF